MQAGEEAEVAEVAEKQAETRTMGTTRLRTRRTVTSRN
jgi:hypothetical protein